jgi:hypothetical protein
VNCPWWSLEGVQLDFRWQQQLIGNARCVWPLQCATWEQHRCNRAQRRPAASARVVLCNAALALAVGPLQQVTPRQCRLHGCPAALPERCTTNSLGLTCGAMGWAYSEPGVRPRAPAKLPAADLLPAVPASELGVALPGKSVWGPSWVPSAA